jgi:putative tricarboxylic transport membrane protein
MAGLLIVELLGNLALGLGAALQPVNLGFALLGALIGTLIGVLPGIGPLATLSMLLPVTYYLEPTTALIMLAAIYYGAQYGGSTTAILVNLPGESSAVVTCLDGHAMARQGRAGAALAIAALGSLFAGCVATVVIAVLVVPLTRLAISFSAAEYFALMVLGLIAAVVMAHGSVAKALAMVVIGLLLGLIGTDVHTGLQRFTFGAPGLFDGLDFVAVAVGIFGLGSIISNLEKGEDAQSAAVLQEPISRLWPTRDDFRRAWPASVRGTALGSVLGVLPGGGAVLSSFTAYALERKLARDPSRFGHGAVEGVAGPESANNAGAQTAFIPMLTLGIPPNPVMAVMIGAMMIHGIRPGPEILE